MSLPPEKRGPKVGDAASLWNFTPSPGWTKDEVAILKLCLMRFGVGQWLAILNTGLLPGKLIQQLNGQTQRLLGQQSLAAYSGLKVDIDKIRADNEKRTDVLRKSGLIIYQGPSPSRELKQQWQREAKEKYSLSAEQLHAVELELEELQGRLVTHVGGDGMCTKMAQLPPVSVMRADPKGLPREMKLQVLRRLQQRLVLLLGKLVAQSPAAQAAAGPQAAALKEACNRRMLTRMGRPKGSAARQGAKLQHVAKKPRRSAAAGEAAGAAAAGGKPPKAKKPSKAATAYDDDDFDFEPGARNDRKRRTVPAAKAAEAAAFEADIAQLQAMGFSRSSAKDALIEADNDLAAALELLCG